MKHVVQRTLLMVPSVFFN